MRVMPDPSALPAFGVRALDDTGTAFTVDPPVLTAGTEPFLTSVEKGFRPPHCRWCGALRELRLGRPDQAAE